MIWLVSWAQALPVAGTLACAFALTWVVHGSIAAGSWLPYALAIAAIAATAAATRAAERPARALLMGPAALFALALWATLSLLWAPIPSLARDEGLLTALYALTLLLPAATLGRARPRLAATAALLAGCAGLALATGAALAFGADPASRFAGGRLAFPISYTNADGAIFALALWPAIVLAARRRSPAPLRAAALAAGAAAAAGVLVTQSKGSVLALAVSLAVVFAVAPRRLRLLVPTLLVLAGPAAAFLPLTAPYRTEGAAPIRHAGDALLAVAAATLVAGLVYAALDARLEVGARARRLAGTVALALLLAGLAGGTAAFFASVPHPGAFFAARWSSFARDRSGEHSTHLLALGSNRYDFWRVSLDELARHPLTGIGARGFGPDYLVHRRSPETPARAHSLPLQTLGEQGLVGFALLALGLGATFTLVLGAVRARSATAIAALGAGVAWVVQASVDWMWSFPAVTVPALVALGIGVARGGAPALRPVQARVVAGALAVLALAALVPPWLASRYTQRGVSTGATSDLALAHRLDPLSAAPLLAYARVEALPQAIPELRAAVRIEPRSVADRYVLGVAYLQAGDHAAARSQLQAALRLKPGDPFVERALRQAGQRSSPRSSPKTSRTSASTDAGSAPSTAATSRSERR